MIPYPTIDEEFNSISSEDLWYYNKLQISKFLNYQCGPAGVNVPLKTEYIVRPAMNWMGMGRNARKVKLSKSTSHLHPGEFWCEIFKGNHYSVDYLNQSQVLCVQGVPKTSETLSKWKEWRKVDKTFEFPEILSPVSGRYPYINCEFIEDHLIEIQFRHNPDFRYGNVTAIPVYTEAEIKLETNQEYIYDPDYERIGFILSY